MSIPVSILFQFDKKALAVPVLNEQLTIAIVAGILLTTGGVIFFSRKIPAKQLLA